MRVSWRVFFPLLVMGGTIVIAGAQPGPPPPRNGGEGRPERPGKEREEIPSSGTPRGERRGMGNYADNFLRAHDRDRDGKVTFDEFRVAKTLENHLEEGKQRIFDQLDKNHDGEIAREELPGGSPAERGPHWLDKDRDGKISFEEFADSEWLKDTPPKERREHFDRMDLNRDEFLTQEDFRRRPPGSRRWDRRGPLFDAEALRKLDKDDDGALSFEEWSGSPFFENVPEERLREWFKRMDRNDDGQLDDADRPDDPPRRGPDRERPEGAPPRGDGAGRKTGERDQSRSRAADQKETSNQRPPRSSWPSSSFSSSDQPTKGVSEMVLVRL